MKRNDKTNRSGEHRGKAGGNAGVERASGKGKRKRAKVENTSDDTPIGRESPPTSENDEPKRRAGTFVPGDPRINRTKPGPGRPTDKFKRWCAKVIADPRTKRAVRRTLQSTTHKAQPAMWKAVAAHAHGQPTAHVDMTHKVTLEDLVDASHGETEG